MKFNIEHLMRAAFQLKASDLHITIGVPPMLRINGELRKYGEDMVMPEDSIAMSKSLVSKKQWETFEEKGELDFSHGIAGVSRFRLNIFRQRSNVSMAIRVVPTKIPSIEDLQLPPILKKVSEKPQGLVLVTGPTGSGKSTTLAAMIDYLNTTMRRHVITLEDPIEYVHRHNKCIIDQREVGHDTQTFANGLRAALRQDPDVILVGEMRDLETIHTAITAAETGHLVFGTLHTSSAPTTIDRIIDVFPPSQQPQVRIQLANVLVSVISQRLFPNVERNGRVAATEILVNTPAVSNLIRSEKVHQITNVMQTSKALGMHTLDMNMNELVKEGRVTKEVVAPYIQERV